MSLGWGLRGSIGGGSLGAMIPGAMIGLVLCVLLNRHSDAGLVAAFAAIGVGFGGQETYGQTVGLSLQPETFWWAILGFVVKGAAWGLLGGGRGPRPSARVSRSTRCDWARNRVGPLRACPLRLHDRRSRPREPRALSESLAWQTAITATVAAFGWDFLDYQTFAPRPVAWTLLVATTAIVAAIVARYSQTRAMLFLVTWTAVASAFRYLLPPSSVGREVVTMLMVFVVLALAMSLMLLRRRHTSDA